MAGQLVRILDGNTFVVCDERGDIQASPTEPTGLFSFDMRYLSHWVLTINGQTLNSLSIDDLHYFELRFFLVPGTGTVYIDAKLSVIRQRAVGNGFHEELTILNHENDAVDLVVRLDAGSDFADLFEVKDALKKLGTYETRVKDGQLHLRYQRETFVRQTRITASAPAKVDKGGLTFKIRIEPHASWTTDLDIVTSQADEDATYIRPKYERGRKQARPNMERSLDRWIADAPRLECDWDPLRSTYRRSLVDLAALRFSPPVAGGRSLPAAGLPWFMTMFGRDSIFTSLQALPFAPELAATTLRVLGDWQGSRHDDFRDEDPGRILHEMRYGEMAAFEERPHSPYYGSVDATPLYVILLDEYERWTGIASSFATSSTRRGPHSPGSTTTPTSWATATSPTSAETSNPGWRTRHGRTPGTPSRTATAGCRTSRGRPASCRATPMTPRRAAHGWPGSCGRTPTSRTRSKSRQPT